MYVQQKTEDQYKPVLEEKPILPQDYNLPQGTTIYNPIDVNKWYEIVSFDESGKSAPNSNTWNDKYPNKKEDDIVTKVIKGVADTALGIVTIVTSVGSKK